MPYATRAQVEARLPSVAVANSAFDATVDEGLVWADKRIDRKLAKRYTVPFSPVPSSISQLAADYAKVFVLESSEDEAAQKEAKRLKKDLDDDLQDMLENGVPELVEAETELQDSAGIAYHSGLDYTSEIAQIDWDRQ